MYIPVHFHSALRLHCLIYVLFQLSESTVYRQILQRGNTPDSEDEDSPSAVNRQSFDHDEGLSLSLYAKLTARFGKDAMEKLASGDIDLSSKLLLSENGVIFCMHLNCFCSYFQVYLLQRL